ncbi:MAG TPA: cupredoxin family protein [Burkholderiales bacterium]|nr:cupredoxin family protein [Burkholderiales bacterium]
MRAIRTAVGLCCVIALIMPFGAVRAASGHAPADHASHAPTLVRHKPWGTAGEPGNAVRTVVIGMTDDMRFTPDTIDIRRGETVKFVLRNDGRLLHELVLGTEETNRALYALILKAPDTHHHGPDMIHVEAGRTDTMVWHFNRAGRFEFACLLPGHYSAGMLGVINVTE